MVIRILEHHDMGRLKYGLSFCWPSRCRRCVVKHMHIGTAVVCWQVALR